MKNYFICGMREAGKTRIASFISGTAYVTYQSRQKNEVDILDTLTGQGFFVSSWKCVDIGGMSHNNENEYAKYIKDSYNVIFVFNGCDFYKEITNFNNGGIINAKIKHFVLSQYKKELANCRNLIFVATHKDQYNKTNGLSIDDNITMKNDIIQALKKANEEYQKATSCERYPYASLFEDSERFYCINAEHEQDVLTMFEKLVHYAKRNNFY